MPAATFSTVSPIISVAMPAAASTTSAVCGWWQGHRRWAGAASDAGARTQTTLLQHGRTLCAGARCAQARACAAERVSARLTQAAEDVSLCVLESLALLRSHKAREVVLGGGVEVAIVFARMFALCIDEGCVMSGEQRHMVVRPGRGRGGKQGQAATPEQSKGSKAAPPRRRRQCRWHRQHCTAQRCTRGLAPGLRNPPSFRG